MTTDFKKRSAHDEPEATDPSLFRRPPHEEHDPDEVKRGLREALRGARSRAHDAHDPEVVEAPASPDCQGGDVSRKSLPDGELNE